MVARADRLWERIIRHPSNENTSRPCLRMYCSERGSKLQRATKGSRTSRQESKDDAATLYMVRSERTTQLRLILITVSGSLHDSKKIVKAESPHVIGQYKLIESVGLTDLSRRVDPKQKFLATCDVAVSLRHSASTKRSLDSNLQADQRLSGVVGSHCRRVEAVFEQVLASALFSAQGQLALGRDCILSSASLRRNHDQTSEESIVSSFSDIRTKPAVIQSGTLRMGHNSTTGRKHGAMA